MNERGTMLKKIVLAPCNTASKIFENEKKYSDPNSLLIFDYRISYEILEIFLRLFKCKIEMNHIKENLTRLVSNDT